MPGGRTRRNDRWLRLLEGIRDGVEPTSNMYMVYGKAIRSLQQEKEDYEDVDSLSKVKFIGSTILSKLKKAQNQSGPSTRGLPPLTSSSKRDKRKSATGGEGRPRKRDKPSKEAESVSNPNDDDSLHGPTSLLRSGTNMLVPRQCGPNMGIGMSFQPAMPPSSLFPSVMQSPSLFQSAMPPSSLFPSTMQSPSLFQSAMPPSSLFPSTMQSPSLFQFATQSSFDASSRISAQTRVNVPNTTDVSPQHPTHQPCSTSLSAESISLSQFNYLDTTHNRVREYSRAHIDVVGDKVWYKIELSTRGIGLQHPMLSHLRNGPPASILGSDRIQICWLAEEAILQFGWSTAPGIEKILQSVPTPSPSILPHQPPDNPSLVDLINAEKRPRNTVLLDPSRKSAVSKEWEFIKNNRKSMSTPSQPSTGTALCDNPAKSSMNAPVYSSSQPSLSFAPLQPAATLKRSVTLPEQENVSKNFTAPSCTTKRRNRGRVSEYTPVLPAIDDTDRHVDIIASQNSQQNSQKTASSSCISADMMEDVTDLTMRSASFTAFDSILFPAGTFEIILILDNRERAYYHSDDICLGLQEHGIPVEQRALVLGDVLWIARRKVPQSGVPNECVVGYILERKRLDDLITSIKDGRFHEQKFRLSNTGLKVFYLIEDFNTAEQREKWDLQIDTARSSVQIVDGFILKETRTVQHTIEYLSTMYAIINNAYKGNNLHVIPPKLVKRHSYLAFQKHLRDTQPDIEYLTSYNCFETLNHKTNNLTSRELFAQMLLCIKGVSAEKAAVIIQYYPTFRTLWEAFREAEKTEAFAKQTQIGKKKVPEAANMLCDIEGKGRKKIGPALSQAVYKVMRTNNYDAMPSS